MPTWEEIAERAGVHVSFVDRLVEVAILSRGPGRLLDAEAVVPTAATTDDLVSDRSAASG